jgi:hypothetical protein
MARLLKKVKAQKTNKLTDSEIQLKHQLLRIHQEVPIVEVKQKRSRRKVAPTTIYSIRCMISASCYPRIIDKLVRQR